MVVQRAVVVAISFAVITAGVLYNSWTSGESSVEFEGRETAFRADYSDVSHPLAPAMTLLSQCNQRMNEVDGYTCGLIRRERVNGQMGDKQAMGAKVRHANAEGEKVTPFGVYLKMLQPSDLRGCEVLYVDGENNGDMLVRKGGSMLAFLTLSISPTSPAAMNGTRYPITEFGMRRLVERTLAACENDLAYDECEVKISTETVRKRDATCIEIVHPQRREHFRHHILRFYIDNENGAPVRFETYDWPETQGGQPVLTEECTYYKVNLNAELSDIDFDRNNPDYRFSKS